MKSQIVIVEENGVSKPHFCCGHCGKIIKDASEANLVWDPDKLKETNVLCKSALCEHKQEMRQGGDYWMGLDLAWFYLKNNSQINQKLVLEKAMAMDRV